MTKWTEFAKEQPPEGYGAIYVTDGTHLSFVRRAQLPVTEVEKWVLAEPEAQALNLTPQTAFPTHWAVEISGLPTVKDREIPEDSAGGPPPPKHDDVEINYPDQERHAPVAAKASAKAK